MRGDAIAYSAEDDAIILRMRGGENATYPAICAMLSGPARLPTSVQKRYLKLVARKKMRSPEDIFVAQCAGEGGFQSRTAPPSKMPTYLALPQGGLRKAIAEVWT